MLLNSIKINDQEFVELKDIIYQNSGIMFAENKKYLLENRLSKRLTDLNFTSFKDYIYYLKYDIKKRQELDTLINLVTINETYFLRERGQLDYLVSNIVPDLIKAGKRSIKIWSAPCSTGEEPYSISILLKDAGLFDKASIEIIATDINSEVVALAKKGEYRQASFRGVPADFMRNFDVQGQSYFIKEEIKRHVRFNTGNITIPSITAMIGKVDVIFCRNVLIYFDMDGKQRTIKNFHNMLTDPGYLCLGHSETLNKISEDFVMKNAGTCIIYMKK